VVVDHRPRPESAEVWKQTAPRFEGSWTLVLEALRGACEG
jgi:hypothetical protein